MAVDPRVRQPPPSRQPEKNANPERRALHELSADRNCRAKFEGSTEAERRASVAARFPLKREQTTSPKTRYLTPSAVSNDEAPPDPSPLLRDPNPNRHAPQSQSLSRSYGSVLPTSLTYINLCG